MQHIKHYCKLIFSTLVVALVFCCYPLVAHADPLTGAMIGSAMASGFSFPGFAGLGLSSSESLIGNFFVDLVPWSDLVHAAHAYVTIRDLIGSNNVEIELSPELSDAGSERIEQLNTHYSLTPGASYTLGTSYAVDGLSFFPDSQFPNLYRRTGPLGYVNFNTSSSISPSEHISYTLDASYGPSTTQAISILGNARNTDTFSHALGSFYVYLRYDVQRQRFEWLGSSNPNMSGTTAIMPYVYLSSTGFTFTNQNQDVSRAADSLIIDADNRPNTVVIPASYLGDTQYTSGQQIFTEAVVEFVLDAIAEAGFNGDVISSDYADTPDPPAPSTTISDTPYTTLNEVFDEFKEWFGDIYDGLTDFRESFGDWVDDVAAGWTEVFGDIYDTLAGFHESFGDFADTIGTAVGDIADTISDIADGVADIVDDIVSGDFDFIDGFWKNFQAPFLPFFNTIKSHLGIWHYVVEWLASIGSAFTFFFGVMSNTGYSFVLPIYAAFAGTVVLAVYRRFGK